MWGQGRAGSLSPCFCLYQNHTIKYDRNLKSDASGSSDTMWSLSDGPKCDFGIDADERCYQWCLGSSPDLSRWSSEARRPMSAMERTIGRRFASFFWFWWWCCFSNVSRTFFLTSFPSGEYISRWSKTMSKAEIWQIVWVKMMSLKQDVRIKKGSQRLYVSFNLNYWEVHSKLHLLSLR